MDGAGSYSVAHSAGLLPTELTGMWGWILLRSPHQGRGSPPAPTPTKQRPGGPVARSRHMAHGRHTLVRGSGSVGLRAVSIGAWAYLKQGSVDATRAQAPTVLGDGRRLPGVSPAPQQRHSVPAVASIRLAASSFLLPLP